MHSFQAAAQEQAFTPAQLFRPDEKRYRVCTAEGPAGCDTSRAAATAAQ